MQIHGANPISGSPLYAVYKTADRPGTAESDKTAESDSRIKQAEKTVNASQGGQKLDQQEQQQLIQQLKQRDREVRAHEAAHKATAGNLAKGGATFSYERGPDGNLYATGGEVRIDTSPVTDNPEATLHKANQIRAAALAPAQPSPQDLSIAAEAVAMAAEARSVIATERKEESQSQFKDKEESGDKQSHKGLQSYQETAKYASTSYKPSGIDLQA